MNIRSISILARAAAHAATEVFSAKLIGDNEVPPNNTAGAATFRMEVGSTITFSITFSGLSTNLFVAPLALRTHEGGGWRHDILVRRWEPAGLSGGHVGNHYRDDHGTKRYRADGPRH